MNSSAKTASDQTVGKPVSAGRPTLSNTVARRFLKTCEGIEVGHLTVTTPDGERYRFGNGGGREAELVVRDWGAISALAARGDIGFGEAYIQGLWDSSSIEDLTSLALENEDALDSHLHGSRWNQALFLLTDRFLRRNSRKGSKRNIQAHYDVGNDFYRLWLDPTLTYSSALYANPDASLEEAQTRKYNRLLEQTEGTGESVLEIGCGWGGFAEAAADQGRNVTGLTISPSQHAFATGRLAGKSANIALCDYRDVR
ncbi:MAG: class I SAM-dependent methyltransferase, partial [Alphaproteobacteria bacterium]|nr:class I SAM-dependent methyltransferase [Alphaproteobacteria bacterium]